MRTKLSSLLLAASFGAALALVGSAAEARGGHGHGGHGHGFGRAHAHFSMHRHGTPPGWSRGRKIGWRGGHCPPGLWKQGRC